ncbi:MAG: hypothetical protein ACOC5I_00420, partial [Gemmatimonadota bacterium]
LHPWLDAFLVPAALAGMVPASNGGRVVDRMATYVPVDSAESYFETRPVWLYGWMIGAYHATYGDTALARRWAGFFDGVPEGGSPPTWGAALAADIGARLSARLGDDDAALERARSAFRLWSIHTENVSELMPEPSMRLNLAVRYEEIGMADSAQALLASLVAPTGWFGFLTARACFELGEIAAAAGDRQTAQRRYLQALEFWEDGGPAVATWRDEARRRLEGPDRALVP